MMALFLCLWLTAQDTKIKDAVERAFRNPFSAVNKESTGIIPNKDASAPDQGSRASSTPPPPSKWKCSGTSPRISPRCCRTPTTPRTPSSWT